ncbi:hypothetical protein DL770_008414 [Monosporascus sp. CRB-9-2]|nr:hypothetical protein DL770_008414 [Monosporascus sp. CRB-9-2]
MSFGWSASDIAAALQLLNKIRISLKDTGGAVSDYQEEVCFLQTILLTLRHLEALQAAPLDLNLSNNIQYHSDQIREPLGTFLRDIQRIFETNLGADASKLKKALSTSKKIQWALSTSKKVKKLREKIACPLSAILVAMSQQIISKLINLSKQLLEVRGRQEVPGGALQPLAARGPRLALLGRQVLDLGGDGEQLV